MAACDAFCAATGIKNRHLQTLVPVVLARFQRVTYKRQELVLPDGDFVDLDWNRIPDTSSTRPILLVFHGLEGSSKSHYCQSMVRYAEQQDWHAVVMNFRSCSGRLNRMPRLYHSGETADAAFLINCLKKRYPDAPLFGVGISLGGNMLLKLAGEQGRAFALDGLVSISAPIRLEESTRFMLQGLSRYYQAYLLRALKHKAIGKFRQFDYQSTVGLSIDEITACKDIREFDNLFTARIHGYRDAQDYYQRCSAVNYLADIQKPCLLVHAHDDPLVPAHILPESHTLPHAVQVQLTERGGHAGFTGGSLYKSNYWPALCSMAFLKQIG